MQSGIILFALTITIAFAIAFIIVYAQKHFFKPKGYYIASNTSRGFALVADFLFLNTVNIVYKLVKVFLDPIYRGQFQVFAEKVFHGGGYEMGQWFWRTQTFLLGVYAVYSLASELLFKSTPAGYFLGLRLEDSNPSRIIVRNLLKPISILIWPVAMILSKFNSHRMWIHDLVSKIHVIQLK